ncbi:MAG: hypothetical protein IJZ54_08245 [Clostridia bacterium]|nr:hypothetical protein [Clostridia bacterium]
MKKSAAFVAVILVLCCMLSACGKASENLEGSWTHTEDGVSITLVFNADGTGKIEALGGLMSVQYTYKLDGDTIVFHELNQEILGSNPYTMKIKGDELSLTAGGEVMVFTKDK